MFKRTPAPRTRVDAHVHLHTPSWARTTYQLPEGGLQPLCLDS